MVLQQYFSFKLKNLVVNRRGLKAAPTADVDQENTQYYAYIPVPRKTEEFFGKMVTIISNSSSIVLIFDF